MRFFCTCDCQETAHDLAELQSKYKRLEADLADLFERHLRLQGRYAQRAREAREAGDASESGAVSDATAPARGNPMALAMLAKRRPNVSR